MRKRSIAVVVLVVTFLLSAWSNVIATAFCPRYVANHVAETHERLQPAGEQPSCHHEMAEMEMGRPSATEVASDTETPPSSQPTLDSPEAPCAHCWVHAQPASLASTLAAPLPSSQIDQADGPAAISSAASTIIYLQPITPLDHGPPGKLLPRHLLLNVFRI